MRITFRLIFWLVFVVTAVVFLLTRLQVRQEQQRLEEDLERRALILAESLQEVVEPLIEKENLTGIRRLVERFGGRERLVGIALFAKEGELLAMTARLVDQSLKTVPRFAEEAMLTDEGRGIFIQDGKKKWHLQALPFHQEEEVAGVLILLHDARYIRDFCIQLWRQNFIRLLLHALLISLTTLLVLRWSLILPMAKTVEWLKRVRTGEADGGNPPPKEDLFAPLVDEVTSMAESLAKARATAEQEARLRHAGESRWTPERLKEHMRTVLQDRPLLVIANREPYMHTHQGRQIQCIVPASGLVTAVEPILRACGGTWIAHASGDADRETADEKGRLRVPPEEPLYTLRRVWLTKEEEEGYYYGFSNEGLWPLCHIAHTRPLFRIEDWTHYVRVNEKFAKVALEELTGTENPCVLIQDYHFALLPRLIKEKRPDAKVALFWHIPWPNPEAFGICPWARELLQGMLGADLLGFHIQFHCNNFLDTVDRMLESRIDWEQFAVNREGHVTRVEPFPISIAGTDVPIDFRGEDVLPTREELLEMVGVSAKYVGVGVDRIDYTKGIAERFRAVERFLEAYPVFVGKFTFVELGAPSRTLIKRYGDLGEELEAEAERINHRFQDREWKPLVFLKKHHSHKEILPFYRAADFCLVASLHDGMNLVAKEFVASRSDGRGVLILSHFAGASRELRDALLVNPYDIEQVAESIHHALAMDPKEQETRMARMRQTIQEHNVYEWAAHLVSELAQLRPGRPKETSLGIQAK